jgi:hypothetical protein
MVRSVLSLAFLALASGLCAQAPDASFGLRLGKVPEVLYAQLPRLPKNQGILVEAVEADSPAWRGGLRPFDVIVAVDTNPLVDSRAIDNRLRQLKPGESAALAIFRAGREMLLSFDGHSKQDAVGRLTPKALLKPGGPPAVTIHLQPTENGQVHLTLSYYLDDSGKMEQLVYMGPLGQIEKQIQADARQKHLPDRLQDLVEVALRRVRTINQNQK